MSKKVLSIAIASTAVAIAAVTIIYFIWFSQRATPITKDFSSYVTSHTSGTISTRDAIRITFSSNVVPSTAIGKVADSRLLKLKPSTKGALSWVTDKTLEFKPYEPLKGDTEYRIVVAMERIFEKIPAEYSEFIFTTRTIKQEMEISVDGLEFYSEPTREERRVAGVIQTADFANSEDISKTIVASQDGKPLKTTWSSSADGRTHTFWIEGVSQNEGASKVAIQSEGKAIGVHSISYTETEIPPKGAFYLMSHKVVQSPEQYIELRFAEPLDPSQNLRGLIHAKGIADLRLVADKNIVRAYPSSRMEGTFTFEIADGLRSANQQRLPQASAIVASFEAIKPQLRLVGNGVILPSSGGLLFPFQAVNLRAVDITVHKVFEKNIPQFLQVNSLAENSEIKRVGRLLVRKTVMLNQGNSNDFSRWNTYSIDLSQLIQTEPGAIYRVTLDIRKEYSTFPCSSEEQNQSISMIDERYDDKDDNFDSYYYYDDDEDYYYDWRQRENPCNSSYYRNKAVQRNVLSSDLGLVAKAGTEGSLLVVVTNLTTAQPANGVEVELTNYQQQVIANATTDSKGITTFKLTEQQKPFLAIAKSGKQRGYLKLDPGSSLTLSSFDVSGAAIQKGLKGYIYGERGVWRPGDTLFVSFILEDKGKTLPDNHPITFELNNPRGQLVHRAVANRSTGGIYSFPVATSADIPTGTYMARVKVGGASFQEALRIETIMPNRLKINLKIEGESIHFDKSTPISLSSSWLHGTPARNLKAQVDAILTQTTTTFDGYTGYTFDDPARTFYADAQKVFEGNLNDKGEARFNPSITVEGAAPGMLRANLTTRVFEEGGAFSTDRFSTPYYPYKNFVGIKMPETKGLRSEYVTDTTHTVDIVLLSSGGKPVAGQSLTVEVYKIDWRWWWERGRDDLSNYISSSYHKPIQRATVTTGTEGKALFKLRINHPEWGRFLVRAVDPNGGHAAGIISYFDWPGWVSRENRTAADASTLLAFATNKERYNVDETVTVTIPSPSGGKILLTIENGARVLQTHWIDAKSGETQFQFKATTEMTPNVYVSAMLTQPHGQTANDLPLRMYGIYPIVIEDPKTHINPVISVPKVLEPEKRTSVTVSEKSGKPMAFTVAIVDDGLLDITRFKTPNPWQQFYAREALGVNTWDIYDMVLGASAGLMQRIISVGGDDESKPDINKTANRFKPVVRYFGPFQIGKGEKKRIDFTMPNYVGSVRVMVVAAKDGAYGSAEQTVAVRKPLMVLATLPRVLGPNEEVSLPVSVFAMDPSVKQVRVWVEPNENLRVVGELEQQITFTEVGDRVVRFSLKVAGRLGVGKVKVYAEGGKERASHEIELQVRNPNPPMTLVLDTTIRAGEQWNAQYNAFGMAGTNSALVELSSLPPANLGERLQYLLGYPHGCLEQTVSKAFPQLFVSKMAQVDESVRKSAEENVRYALDRLMSFRTADGGLSLWAGGTYPDEWASTYAGHFMLEAQRLGYSIPQGLLDGWKQSTTRVTHTWNPTREGAYRNNDLMQAYRLYVLALAKTADLGAMNRLREVQTLSVAARWRLAAAYVLAGNPEGARNLVATTPPSVTSYREQAYTYGSHTRDMAMIAETLILLGDLERAMPLLLELSKSLSGNQWLSTQEISFGLLAFSKFSAASKQSEGIDAMLALNGKPSKRVTSNLSILQSSFVPLQVGANRVEVKNSSKGLLYARVIASGIPTAGNEVSHSNNLAVDVNYYLMNGSSLSPKSIEQGTDFYADITVKNLDPRGGLEQLILSVVVPSGWEIRNSRLDEGQLEWTRSSPFDFQDIRDDRVYTYFGIPMGQSKSFRLLFNAAYVGRYYMPGVTCEAMYDNSINARNTGTWVEVVAP